MAGFLAVGLKYRWRLEQGLQRIAEEANREIDVLRIFK